MILERLEVGELQVNCYILAESENSGAIIIDPGKEESKINRVLAKHKLHPVMIINTHGHIDHIGCDDSFNVPVYIHRLDSVLLKDPDLNLSSFLMSSFKVDKGTEIKTVEDKDIIELGKLKLMVIHTPGHTPGGISLFLDNRQVKILFSGDALCYRSIGRTDFPGAEEKTLVSSIKEKLFKLPPETIVYPGHGPSSTIGAEAKNNPFLK